ncbi:hypothetical protein AOLI_G00314390 [Acnodon oligacanthus]
MHQLSQPPAGRTERTVIRVADSGGPPGCRASSALSIRVLISLSPRDARRTPVASLAQSRWRNAGGQQVRNGRETARTQAAVRTHRPPAVIPLRRATGVGGAGGAPDVTLVSARWASAPSRREPRRHGRSHGAETEGSMDDKQILHIRRHITLR